MNLTSAGRNKPPLSIQATCDRVMFHLDALVIRLHAGVDSSPWLERIRRVVLGFCVWPLAAWWIWHDTTLPRPVKCLAWLAAAVWLYFLFTGQRAGT
jgi:hypothetical protein